MVWVLGLEIRDLLAWRALEATEVIAAETCLAVVRLALAVII
jgi:hypothetical protein